MDLVVVIGAAVAAAGTAAVVPTAVRSLRRSKVPIAESLVAALLFLSVDWHTGDWPTWQVAAVFFGWAALLTLYPDGRPTPTWTVALLAAYAAVLLAGWVASGGFDAAPWAVLLLVGLAAAGGAQVWRYRRRSSPAEREASQWLLLGLVATVSILLTADLAGLTSDPDTGSWWWAVLRLVGLVLPLSAAFGLAAATRTAANLLLHRAVTAGATLVSLALLYRMVDPYLGAGGTAALMAVASPALLLGFDRLVEPVVYASASRPAMKRLGDQLQASLGPDDVIGAVEKVLRDSLGVPNVAVELGPSVAGDRLGAVSEQQPVADRFPVTYQGRHVATLVVAPRPAEPALTGRDHLIVATLAQQAGPALHGARVVHELRSARERLVSAREEERRRIRRDLHDDLGPSLAGLRLTASALGSHLRADIGHLDAAAARQLADELARGIGDASGLVRRVVYDLQTAGVDGRGLLATLQHRLTRTPCDSDLRVVLNTDLDDGAELPAAVEVAAARIVTEAVTNARRHAHAGVCTVEIHHTTERLTIEIRDDGHGLDPDTPLGVGLRSIEERADELGGSSELRSSPAGTNVRVTLPLRPVTTAEPS